MAPAAFDWKDVIVEPFHWAEHWHYMMPMIAALRSSGLGLQIKSDGTSRERERKKEDDFNSTINTSKRGKIEQWSERREPKRQWCFNNQH
eukprot:scaffold54518_cov51-Attheya_sp.AAC.2